MRGCLSLLVTVAACASLVTAAAAQTPVRPPSSDVVVTAKRDHRDAAHRFVDGITVDKNEQVAQFGEPVCPLVLGLPPAYNAAVLERFVKDAQDAGVRVRGSGCTPNIVIMIADDGQKLLPKLHTARPALFEATDLHAMQALLGDPGPVHAWQGLELMDNGGMPVGIPSASPLVPASGVVIDSYSNAHNFTPSRLEQAFRERIDSAFVVMDAKAIIGLTITQIADYAVMRALAVTRDPKGGSLGGDSILTLFDKDKSGPGPASLSPGDAAYLHALYATYSGVIGAAQRSSMALAVSQALSGADPQEK